MLVLAFFATGGLMAIVLAMSAFLWHCCTAISYASTGVVLIQNDRTLGILHPVCSIIAAVFLLAACTVFTFACVQQQPQPPTSASASLTIWWWLLVLLSA